MKQRPSKIKILLALLAIFLLLALFTLFLVRIFGERHLDDVNPEIPCKLSLLKKSDILYVIPKFNNKSIAENQTWCKEILALNKTLGLHGVYHTYEEFNSPRSQEYLQEGIDIFEECFGFYPQRFKPPQLAISEDNSNTIKKTLKLDTKFSQLTHKAYHCDDTGIFPNWLVDTF